MSLVIPQVVFLAINVWMESRGESQKGKLAVAYTTVTRARDRRWPDTIHDVVMQALQFSWTNPRDPNRMRLDEIKWEDATWGKCLKAACDAYYGLEPDPTSGANHYHNPKVASPSWHDPLKVTATIDSHIYEKH